MCHQKQEKQKQKQKQKPASSTETTPLVTLSLCGHFFMIDYNCIHTIFHFTFCSTDMDEETSEPSLHQGRVGGKKTAA